MDEAYEKRGYLLEDFRLFHLRDSRGTKVDSHYHEFCKLLMLISGSGGYVVEGRRYLLQPGDLVLSGRRCVHRPEFESCSPYERNIAYISPEFLQRESVAECSLEECFSGAEGPVLRLEDTRRRQLFALAASLERELSGDEYGRSIVCNALLLRLLVEIGREQRRAGTQRPGPVVPRDGKILDILRDLDGHLTEEVRIDQLAERFYISKFHMMRRFREETGTTVHTYLSDRRLMLARDLIAQGMAATDACFRSGFRSYSSFSRAYGKLFGTTPTGRADMPSAAEELYE